LPSDDGDVGETQWGLLRSLGGRTASQDSAGLAQGIDRLWGGLTHVGTPLSLTAGAPAQPDAKGNGRLIGAVYRPVRAFHFVSPRWAMCQSLKSPNLGSGE